MSVLTRKRIRMVADASKLTSEAMLDVFNSNSTPELWKGNDVQFEIAIYQDGALVTDISNIASLTLEVKSGSARSGAPVMTKTLAAVDLDGTLTNDTWADKTKQHALVIFTGDESNLDVGSNNTEDYWLIVAVTTNDSPGRSISLQYTTLKVVEDGTGNGGDAPNFANNHYTKGESDARFVQKHENLAFKQWANGTWYHYISDTGLWYPEVALIVDSVPQLTLGDGVASP